MTNARSSTAYTRPEGTPRLIYRGERGVREPALLKCEGHPSCGDWVKHEFAGTSVIPFGLTKEGEPDTAEEQIYRCSLCGSTTRWGLEGEKKPEVKKRYPKSDKSCAE
jgi:hypothetical protein